MTTVAAVKLWGRRIGAVSQQDDRDYAAFQYDPDFASSAIEISPIVMPLANRVYAFPELSRETFRGLPGLLADSLPDKFGNALIDAWLATQGRSPASFNAVERLCYTGTRGMGALEFEPATGPEPDESSSVEVGALVELASRVLARQSDMRVSLAGPGQRASLTRILQVGTSAGGARAKSRDRLEPTHERSPVGANRGRNRFRILVAQVRWRARQPRQRARRSGRLRRNRVCLLLHGRSRRHLHEPVPLAGRERPAPFHGEALRSLGRPAARSTCNRWGALGHYDYNSAGAYSYEQTFALMRQLGSSMAELEQQFRRMAFNIVARNQDDHVKNIAFLMDKQGHWSLAPAFDVTYSYNPAGLWTALHQMSMNGKRDAFTLEDFKACARAVALKRGRAEAILDEVRAAVGRWPEFAERARVSSAQTAQIQRAVRLEIRRG